METLSGNSSDKVSFQETLRKIDTFKQQLQNAPDFIYVADSALYVKDKLLAASNLRWLTRVPENIKEAKELVENAAEGYKYHELTSCYDGIQQRWQVVYSEQAFNREQKTLTKKIAKKHDALTKTLWHLGNKVFACGQDANMAI